MTFAFKDGQKIRSVIDQARLLEGRTFAKESRARLKAEVAKFQAEYNTVPGLAVVLVGDDPSSIEYSRVLAKSARDQGMYAEHIVLPLATTAEELAVELQRLNADPNIHGISIQWPLPPHITFEQATDALDPRKDVEGYHPLSTGRLYAGLDTFVPATPLGGLQLLDHYGYSVAGQNCLVIGKGVTVGRPLITLLMRQEATVFVVHSHTPKSTVNHLAQEADFVFSAAGSPGLVTGEMLKPGAVVVDFGTSYVDGKMVGDVDMESVMTVASAVTPTPGGTTPVTTVALLGNVLKAARQQVEG